jgi:hypothetical protein
VGLEKTVIEANNDEFKRNAGTGLLTRKERQRRRKGFFLFPRGYLLLQIKCGESHNGGAPSGSICSDVNKSQRTKNALPIFIEFFEFGLEST